MKPDKITAQCLVFALFTGYACIVTAQESVLYQFTGENYDGNPAASVVFDAKGNLYGTTAGGYKVFQLKPLPDGSWEETIISKLSGAEIGDVGPIAGLAIDGKGNLFWSSITGGSHNCGAVYELTPEANETWTENVLHQFGTGADGCGPQTTLTFDDAGNLYGTTYGGGLHNAGAVFQMVEEAGGNWSEKVIWSFQGSPTDGLYPQGGLVLDHAGNVYGTTGAGGVTTGNSNASGIAFELMPQADGSWSEKVLHTFGVTSSDGAFPEAPMILDDKGNLYGTTAQGGGGKCTGCGTVFELLPQSDGTWTEQVLHRFSETAPDGEDPRGGLVFDSKGDLFGSTFYGGSEANSGIAFELVPPASGQWTERVLHIFAGGLDDGSGPEAGMIFDSKGNLYGTTRNGGSHDAGTVFEILDPDRTQAPEFSLAAGTYTSTKKVSITDPTPGAKIYYTTDGDQPTTSSTQYTGPISVKKSETIKAIATAADLEDSLVATAKYTIEFLTAAPVFSLKAGTYKAVKSLTITDSTADATIYFTTNGHTPTTISKKYSGPISISATETVSAIAVAPGHIASSVTSAAYIINLPAAATPAFSPKPGTYSAGQKVTITDATPGATIYYTTGGKTPTTSSVKYTSAGIVIDKTETIRAIAVADDHTQSAVASATYTIQ